MTAMPRAMMLAGLLGGCSAASGPDCQLVRAAVLPFHISNSGLIVDTLINGEPAHLVFDTGSFTTVLTPDAAARLKLGTGVWQIGEAIGVGGREKLVPATAKTFDLSNLHGENFALVVGDIFHGSSHPADGLLSTDFLSKYDIDIDFVGQRIILYEPQGTCRSPVAALQPPLYVVPMVRELPWADGRSYDPRVPTEQTSYTPRLSVQIGDTPLVADLDTGADGTAVYRTMAKRHGVNLDAVSGAKEEIHGIGPRSVKAIQHIFDPMTIGDLTVANLPIEIINQDRENDAEMLLGADFMSKVHVWISYSSQTVILQYPPQRSPDDPGALKAATGSN